MEKDNHFQAQCDQHRQGQSGSQVCVRHARGVAKGRAWTEWSKNINTAEGKQKMFKKSQIKLKSELQRIRKKI